MPELLLELFSEEIPARMQARAASDLARLVAEALAPLSPAGIATFAGPRRIALSATVAAEQAAQSTAERGPRTTAPDAALAGFLRKHGAGRDQLVAEGDFWVLHKQSPATPAAALIAQAIPALIRRFPWPKSMRWGTSPLLWVRPLRRILCILDGQTVPFTLADAADPAHGLAAGNQTEGHRFHAPGPVAVASAADWQVALLARNVVVDAADRRAAIHAGLTDLAAAKGLSLVPDDGLLDEVAGLVEWPVPLLGRIDPAFMDLPAEVMQVSMRVNQRYFALRDSTGAPAPYFAFAANVAAPDGGAAIVAGNERVLRARFSDARHFWDGDRRTKLADRVSALDSITFHAKLGSQGARARRLERLAAAIAPLVGADPVRAARAALLAKADLTTGMVAEFPELQGVVGGYYAAGEGADIAAAIATHYAPKGPADPVPTAPVSVAVALADKLDQLCAFFAVGEIPTGSGDPYALRRAALGVVRIVRENRLRLSLRTVLRDALWMVLVDTVQRHRLDLLNLLTNLFVPTSSVTDEQRSPTSYVAVNSFIDRLNRSASAIRILFYNGDARQALPQIQSTADAWRWRRFLDEVDAVLRIRQPESSGNIIGLTMRFDDHCQLPTFNGNEISIPGSLDILVIGILDFIADRLRIQLRAEGKRHDVLAAVFASGADDDIVRLLARTDAVTAFLTTPDGADLLAAARRAANILRIEDRKDGPHRGVIDPALLRSPQEKALDATLTQAEAALAPALADERYADAMTELAQLRPVLDAFFDEVTVNAPDPALRENRLRLLSRVGAAMALAADFSRIEG